MPYYWRTNSCQQLEASLQALLTKRNACWPNQQARQQQHLHWLTRKTSSTLNYTPGSAYAAQEARESAQLQLAALTLAQLCSPVASALGAHSGTTCAAERVRQHSDEVNAATKRIACASASAPARIDIYATERHRAALKTWLAEHDGIRVWRSELAVASIINTTILNDRAQLSQCRQQQLSDTRQRDALPPLTPDLHATGAGGSQSIAYRQRPLRHRLAALSGANSPKQKRQAQLQQLSRVIIRSRRNTTNVWRISV